MPLNSKKIKKNLPYLFIFIAFMGIVGGRVWWQQHAASQAEADASAQEKNMPEPLREQFSARISVYNWLDSPQQLQAAPVDAEYYVHASSLFWSDSTTADMKVEVSPPPAARKNGQTVHLVFDLYRLPLRPEDVAKAVDETRKLWVKQGYKVGSVFINYTRDSVDRAKLAAVAAAVHEKVSPNSGVEIALDRAWLDGADGAQASRDFANMVKYVQGFVVKFSKSHKENESLPDLIRLMDSYKLGFSVITDKKPDLMTLRKEIRDTTYFSGLIVKLADPADNIGEAASPEPEKK